MRKVTLACVLLPGALAALAGPAQAARGMEIALQDDLLFLHRGAEAGQYFDRDLAFDRMRAMQGSALRVNILWADAVANDQVHLKEKPKPVRYDWAPYESIVRLARGYGVKVQFTLTGPAPAWGTESGRAETGYYRPKARLFGEFARAAAKRFKGKVSRYSIWNEPNWDTWLGPLREGPRRYRQLYQVGYAAIKKVNPRAKVWIGELSPYDTPHSIAPLKFLREVACVNDRYRLTRAARRQRKAGILTSKPCAGGTLKADGFAQHPYEFKVRPRFARRPTRDDVTIGSLDRLTRALDRLEAARALVPRTGPWMPLYLTEFGYFRAGKRKISEARRAAWSVEGFEIAQRNPRVKQILYYVFVRPPWGIFFDLSLIDAKGPRYTGAYRALVAWGTRAAAAGRIKRPGAKRPGVSDDNPPDGPAGSPPPPPPGGGSPPPPPSEPSCPVPVLPGVPCPVPPS